MKSDAELREWIAELDRKDSDPYLLGRARDYLREWLPIFGLPASCLDDDFIIHARAQKDTPDGGPAYVNFFSPWAGERVFAANYVQPDDEMQIEASAIHVIACVALARERQTISEVDQWDVIALLATSLATIRRNATEAAAKIFS